MPGGADARREPHMGPGDVVEREWTGRVRVRAGADRHTRRPGAAIGDVVVLSGGDESGLVRLQSRPPPV